MDTKISILGGVSTSTGTSDIQTATFTNETNGFGITQILPYPSSTPSSWVTSSSYAYGGYTKRSCDQVLISATKSNGTYTCFYDFAHRNTSLLFTNGVDSEIIGELDETKIIQLNPTNKTFYFYAPSLTVNLPTSVTTDSDGNISTICEDVSFDLYYVYSYRTRTNSRYYQNFQERRCVLNYPYNYYSDSVDDYTGGVCRFANIDGITQGIMSGATPYYGIQVFTHPSAEYNDLQTSTPSGGVIRESCGFYFKSSQNVILYDYTYGTDYGYSSVPYIEGNAYIKLCFE